MASLNTDRYGNIHEDGDLNVDPTSTSTLVMGALDKGPSSLRTPPQNAPFNGRTSLMPLVGSYCNRVRYVRLTVTQGLLLGVFL